MVQLITFTLLVLANFLSGLTPAASQHHERDLSPRGMLKVPFTLLDGREDYFEMHPSFVETDTPANETIMADFRQFVGNTSDMGALLDILEVLSRQQNDTAAEDDTADNFTGPPGVERFTKYFRGINFRNASFCGWPAPIPFIGRETFFDRPVLADCAQLAIGYVAYNGYYQVGDWKTKNTQFQLVSYKTCMMTISRFDEQIGDSARVGTFDIVGWLTAAMLVAQLTPPDPVEHYFMAPVWGFCTCMDMGHSSTNARLEFQVVRDKGSFPLPTPSSMSSMSLAHVSTYTGPTSLLTKPTPTVVPFGI